MPLKGNEGSAATTAELATELEQIVRERMVGDGVISFTISLYFTYTSLRLVSFTFIGLHVAFRFTYNLLSIFFLLLL